MTEGPLSRLLAASERLGTLQRESEALARVRGECVRELQAQGWSLQRIADALSVSKTAVANMAAK